MRIFPALPILLLAGSLSAQSPSDSPAFARAHSLRRGVNASMWFAQAHDYSPSRLRSYTTATDIALMHRMGFDHVRLSIDGDELMRGSTANAVTLNAPFVAELDRAISTMLQNQLRVIVDLHPSDSFKERLRTNETEAACFAQLWRALATHFASSDPERVLFEVLNEPEFTDAASWTRVETPAITAIRQAAPRHTIIATAARYSGLTDLLAMEPVDDPNVIYTFHDYEPFPFTHQGATWTSTQVRPLRRVPYPSSTEAIAGSLSQEPTLLDQHWLDEYGLNHWDAARIDAELSFADRWSHQHRVPVYCGEFGVYKMYADPAMRAAWLRDTRTALEHYGIGWAVWDYQGSFAVIETKDGQKAPDPAVAIALGLPAPSAAASSAASLNPTTGR